MDYFKGTVSSSNNGECIGSKPTSHEWNHDTPITSNPGGTNEMTLSLDKDLPYMVEMMQLISKCYGDFCLGPFEAG